MLTDGKEKTLSNKLTLLWGCMYDVIAKTAGEKIGRESERD